MRRIMPWILFAVAGRCWAGEPYSVDRCRVVPLPGDQASFEIDGREVTRWHFGAGYPRPFFFPLNGPSGVSLTRMGHPGAPNHDHHRSLWLAHHDVAGVNFWSDGTDARVRQKQWCCYRDGDEEAVMASRCGWFDAEGAELMEQDLVAAMVRRTDDEHALEIQITLRPGPGRESIELGKTNFGLLAVRVAKSVSVHFGAGRICDSEGREGEAAIFGQRARWMDYSGPVAVGEGADRKAVVEGITCFDHPENPRYPTRWHVREDGWMGASFCLDQAYVVRTGEPLTLRYLLCTHRGAYDAAKAEAVHAAFAGQPGFHVVKSTRKHRQYEVERRATVD